MEMPTLSKLRDRITSFLHQRLKSGTRIDVPPASKLARLKKRRAYKGDPDQIAGMDWLTHGSELK
jgi:hypothetical protein